MAPPLEAEQFQNEQLSMTTTKSFMSLFLTKIAPP
eukprot:CAMPEP_0170554680 /NCGR_PEP_ID=MMETSP0211-20121228/12559_1 /TAXON_ID=311385 /ORGANISM="Pseudokeronopsis sp., Strain OXSARD2" /LENGTH=34 /DNA_ID= /DNA_START= /DNA_END= /DNA_ORIENTATION=